MSKMSTKPVKPLYEIPTLAQSLVSKFPKVVQPYLKLMRLDSPTGGFLLLFPGYFGIGNF